jgi:hypothetical protein
VTPRHLRKVSILLVQEGRGRGRGRTSAETRRLRPALLARVQYCGLRFPLSALCDRWGGRVASFDSGSAAVASSSPSPSAISSRSEPASICAAVTTTDATIAAGAVAGVAGDSVVVPRVGSGSGPAPTSCSTSTSCTNRSKACRPSAAQTVAPRARTVAARG